MKVDRDVKRVFVLESVRVRGKGAGSGILFVCVPSLYFHDDINPNIRLSTERLQSYFGEEAVRAVSQQKIETILLSLCRSLLLQSRSSTVPPFIVVLYLFATGRSAPWRSSTSPCIVLKASQTSRCRLHTQRRVS